VKRRARARDDCWTCAQPDDRSIWTNTAGGCCRRAERCCRSWCCSTPRLHYAEPGDLPDELAAESGVLVSQIERAIRGIGDIGRVHVCRWGDASEHLHWWFMARPARIPQLIGSFAAIWDDILPVTPDDAWNANLDAMLEGLASQQR
jgi:hypothetical protein